MQRFNTNMRRSKPIMQRFNPNMWRFEPSMQRFNPNMRRSEPSMQRFLSRVAIEIKKKTAELFVATINSPIEENEKLKNLSPRPNPL